MVWQISRWWLFRAIPVLKFNEQRLGPSTLPHLTLYLFHDCIVQVGGCGCIPHHLLPELGVGSFTSPLGLPISLAGRLVVNVRHRDCSCVGSQLDVKAGENWSQWYNLVCAFRGKWGAALLNVYDDCFHVSFSLNCIIYIWSGMQNHFSGG